MKWMETIRKHWLLFMLAAFFLPLIVIRFVFGDTLNSLFSFDAKWSAADMVSYCISYMSMVGTLFLGFATHRQGHILNDIEQRMVHHTQLRALSERQPAVLLLNGKTNKKDDTPVDEVPLARAQFEEEEMRITGFLGEEPKEDFSLRLLLVNSSKTFLELRYPVLALFNSRQYQNPTAHFANEDFYVSLAPGERLGIILQVDNAFRQQILDSYYRLSFELYNSIGERYVEQVQFVNTETASKRKQKDSQSNTIDTVSFGYKYFSYNYEEKHFEAL